MAKRPDTLAAVRLAAQVAKPAKRAGKAAAPTADTLTTAIHIRREHWELLRRAAFARAERTGGRASVSAVLGELIERHRAELERLASQ
jgi:hypothetical protein